MLRPLKDSELRKYGGVLWWERDAEGALDAYAAADEILTQREARPALVRRARIWGLAAQVHRKMGDLEAADRHLEAAMYSLELLSPCAEGRQVMRDLQAALGQVCVEKQEYDRAQELYLLAFSDEKLPVLSEERST